MSITLFIERLIVGAVLIVGGFAILKFTDRLIMMTGIQDWAENIPGGTQSMWKIVGVLVVAAGIVALFGGFGFAGL
jgi:hypothetical protein